MLSLIIFKLLVSFNALAIEKCPSDSYYVKSHPRGSYTKNDGTFVKATQVIGFCRKKSEAYSFWSEKIKDGTPPNWPHINESKSSWSESEKEKFYEAMESLPRELWQSNLKGVYRLKRSKDFPNPASQGGDMIVLYDNAFSSDRTLARIASHELAHQIFDNLNENQKLDYSLATNWKLKFEDRKFFWEPRESGYVEKDGNLSRAEDFANNIEYFLFKPDELNLKTPTALQWINKHFGDKFKLRETK